MQIDTSNPGFVEGLKELDVKKGELLYKLHMKSSIEKELIKEIEVIFNFYEDLIAGHHADS